MKKIISAILSLSICLSFAACAKAQPASSQSVAESQPASSESQSQSTAAEFPVTLTDHLGRSVTIEEKPQSIVSGYYITSSLLIALGLEDNLVGIEAKAKSRPIYSLSAPQVLDLPSVGTAKEFDLEGCAALKPDLVILPVKLKDSAASLEQLGIKVLAVNPEDDALLTATIEMVGKATGTQQRAAELSDFISLKKQQLADAVSSAKKPNVYLGGNSALLSTAGAKMYQNALIEAAGGANVAAELEDSYWAEISYEQLIAWNPDVIVIAPGAEYTVEDVLGDAQLAEVTAVKNGEVYHMPDAFEAWDSPVPSSVLGSLWLASVLHEEAYTPETFAKDTAEFYKTFYDVEIDTSLLEQ